MKHLETFDVKTGVKFFVISVGCLIIVSTPFLYGSIKDEPFYLFLLLLLNIVMIYSVLWISRYKVFLKESSIIRRRVFKRSEIEFNKIHKLYFKEKELIIYSDSKKIKLHADLKNINQLIEMVSSKVNLDAITVKKLN